MGNDFFDISDNETTVKALKAGNEAAFEAVYMRYARPLRAYAGKILKDGELAFEVVQEVFVAVWEKRGGLDAGKPLRHYLLRAVHNNALRMLRAEEARRRREGEGVREREEQENRVARNGGGERKAEEWEEREERAVAVKKAVEGLPEQSRRGVRMSYWEEKKNGEIAELLGISVRTVESILYKAKQKLGQALKKSWGRH